MLTQSAREVEYKIFLNLARVKLLLSQVKSNKFPDHLRWYYLGRLTEVVASCEQDIKHLNVIVQGETSQ